MIDRSLHHRVSKFSIVRASRGSRIHQESFTMPQLQQVQSSLDIDPINVSEQDIFYLHLVATVVAVVVVFLRQTTSAGGIVCGRDV